MPDPYETGSDPYVDHDTGVLRNKFNITSQTDLDDAESDITSLEIAGITINGLPNTDNLSFGTYKGIHKQLFGDIYDWAGELRTINIAKGTTKFCEYQHIEAVGIQIFNELANEELLTTTEDDVTYIKRLAYYYSELNVLHPFREGNGRTLRTFMSILTMHSSGKLLAWDQMDAQENIDACIYAYHRDESKIVQMLKRIIE